MYRILDKMDKSHFFLRVPMDAHTLIYVIGFSVSEVS